MPTFHTGADHKGTPVPPPSTTTVEGSWKSAAADLISARLDLIRIELAEFRAQSARKLVVTAIAFFTAATGWLLLLAGLVPTLAHALHMAWPHAAILLAAIHLVIAALCGLLITKKSTPPFSASLSEFKKDREWLQNLSNRKS